MKFRIFYLLIVLLPIFSCTTPKTNGVHNLPTIDLDSIHHTYIDSCYSKKNLEIPLEPGTNSFINSVDQIRMYGDHFFVLDKQQKSVFKFNRNGDFLQKFNSVGKGPGEYIHIMDFLVNQNKLYILDVQQRIFIYDLKGTFIESSELPFQANYFEFVVENKYIFQDISYDGKIKYLAGIFDLQEKELIDYIETTEKINDDSYPFMRHKCLWAGSEGIYFNYDYSDIVYKITETQIKPVFRFRSSQFPNKEEIIKYKNNPVSRQEDTGKKVFHLSGIFEHENDISFSFRQNRKIIRVIYSMKDNSVKSFRDCASNYSHEKDGKIISFRFPGSINPDHVKKVSNPFILMHEIID